MKLFQFTNMKTILALFNKDNKHLALQLKTQTEEWDDDLHYDRKVERAIEVVLPRNEAVRLAHQILAHYNKNVLDELET